MKQMYDKEKLQNNWFNNMKELQKQKHKYIMKEIKALKEAGITIFNRGEEKR